MKTNLLLNIVTILASLASIPAQAGIPTVLLDCKTVAITQNPWGPANFNLTDKSQVQVVDMGYKPFTELRMGNVVYSTEEELESIKALKTATPDQITVFAQGLDEDDSYRIEGIAPLVGKKPGACRLYQIKEGSQKAELVADLFCNRGLYF